MNHTLVCLHGWGGSKESFTELRVALKNSDITILAPDLPGFGTEPEPPKPWTNDDYANWVNEWIKSEIRKQKIEKFSLLGHSHGGRIALKLAARGQLPIEHLYLCAPAGIRHPRHFKRIFGLTLAKIGKAILSVPGLKKLEPFGKKMLYKLVRVHDYERASDVMRETLIKVSAEDFRPILHSVKIPTDIFWGTEDGMTPYSDAIVMQKGIAGSVVHTYQGIRHGVHREKATEIATVIQARLGGR
jgi:pimeloyl-ACP methyl ester carboxylesterase